jgi:hypothetical protein
VEEDLPYGDMLEKKYQYEPIPEPESSVSPQVVSQPVSSKIEEIAEKEVENIVQDAGVEEAKIDSLVDTKLQTDVQKKFGELFFTTKRIYELKSKL